MGDLVALLQNEVAVRDAARLCVSFMPRLVASKVNNDQQPPGQTMTTVNLNSVMLDSTSSFTNSMWTVLETGTYEINGKLRLADNTPAGISFGIGMGISNVDDAGFLWGTTVAAVKGYAANSVGRHMIFNSRIMVLNKDDKLRLYVYIDDTDSRTIQAAELNAVRIA